MASLADYANNPDVVAYLKAQYAAQQAAQQPGVPPIANSTDVVPFDAALTAANNAATYGYNNAVAQIDAQEPLIRRQYGFDEAGGLDPSNPFGKAQLLKRSYDQAQRGNTNSYASRGQLYSGALQRAKDDAQFGYQANDAALRGQYGQQLAGLAAQRAAAANQLASSKADNYWQWVQSQIQNRAAVAAEPETPAAPPVDYGTPAQPAGPTFNQAETQTMNQAFGPTGLAALAPYANNPDVVAYLQAQYAQQQAVPASTTQNAMALAKKYGRW